MVGDAAEESTRKAAEVLRENQINAVTLVDTGDTTGHPPDLGVKVVSIKDPSSRDFSGIPGGVSACFILPSAAPAGELSALVDEIGRSRAAETTLFSASDEEAWRAWGSLDDVVMGGVSDSGLRVVNNRVLFTGNVSESNSGGKQPLLRPHTVPLTWLQGLRVCGR